MASPVPKKSLDSLTSPMVSPISPNRSNEYPFPRHELRPGIGTRYDSRRGSTASSIQSIGGTLDTSNSNWTHSVNESRQNAISTLLQPPIVRTGLLPHMSAPISSTHKPPTARDIPPVTLSNVPHVENSEFTSYLTQVGTLYDMLQRAKETEEEIAPRLFRNNSKVDDYADLLELEKSRNGRKSNLSRQASLASLASLASEAPKTKRRTSGTHGRRAPQAPTPLTTIPNVYFEDDFHLENPRTFDVVSERSEIVRPAAGTPEERKGSNGAALAPRKALATNAILQEKLSWYMDTIEVHLISSISAASSSFFAALGSLRELHSEAAGSVARIKLLRGELESLDKEMAVGGLEIVQMCRRRENLKQLSDTIHQLRLVVDGVSLCESLVDSGDVEKSLDTIDALERMIAGEQSETDSHLLSMKQGLRVRDLRSAAALHSVKGDLDSLRFRIGKAFESRFLSSLLGDLRQHIETVSTQDILKRWSSSSQRSRGHNREPSVYPAYLALSEQFRTELKSDLEGLHRSHYTSPATSAFREAVLKEIKSTIKRPLPSSNDDDNESVMSASTLGQNQKGLSQQERSSILARNLRALDAAAAEEMLLAIYIGVGESLRRLGTQVKVLLDVTSAFGDPKSPISPTRSPNIAAIDARLNGSSDVRSSSREIQEEMHQALDMSNLLGQAVDIAQNQIVKVLRVRTEQSIRQTPTRFLRYFTLNLLFANECEAVSGRSGTSLKTVVNGQIKDFIRTFGDSEQQSLAQGMDSDKWDAVDFSEQNTEVLGRILEGSDRDPEPWTVGGKVWLQYEEPDSAAYKAASTNGTSKDKAKTVPAIIEQDSFILPNSAMLALHGVEGFLLLIAGIPSLASEIATSLLSYLQLFNSRCTQLILGAGATKSVGLKNITTKHLALASQALSFIATLIPHIREFVRRHAGAGATVSTLMGDFDKVRRLFQEHQQNIAEKLVGIMSGRAAMHVKAMKIIKWDVADPAISPYMDTLVKDTTTLHKVLRRIMPELPVLMIMEPVFQNYKEQLTKALGDVVLEKDVGKERMLRDVDFFNVRTSKITGAGDVGDQLVKLVKDKTVVNPISAVETTENIPDGGDLEEDANEGSKAGEEVVLPKEESTTAAVLEA